MPRLWTEEEVEYLESRVGKTKITTIAKKLNRSVPALELKMKRLGISNTLLESGKITANTLAMVIKVDGHTVHRWIDSHGLKAVKRATREIAKYTLIAVEDFWEWAELNKDKVNFFKIEPFSLMPEPDWVEEERRKDYHNIPKRRAAKWTKEEDDRMLVMIKGGYTQKEIGVVLGRSENAIQRRLSRLRERGITSKVKINLRWSDRELNMMLELEKQGLSDDEIAYELGRESWHIRDKRRNMRRKGEYQGRKQIG